MFVILTSILITNKDLNLFAIEKNMTKRQKVNKALSLNGNKIKSRKKHTD